MEACPEVEACRGTCLPRAQPSNLLKGYSEQSEEAQQF